MPTINLTDLIESNYLTPAVTSINTAGTVSGLTLTGGPITSTGTITLGGTLAVTASAFASQTANTALAAPNGSDGVPTFRAIVVADIQDFDTTTLTNGSLLIYNSSINKWVSSTTLSSQNLEGGEY